MFSNSSVTESKFDDKVHWLTNWLACWTLIVIMMNISQIKNVCQSAAAAPPPSPAPPYIINITTDWWANIPVRWFTFILPPSFTQHYYNFSRILTVSHSTLSSLHTNNILLNIPGNTRFPELISERFVKTIKEQILSIYTAYHIKKSKIYL